MSDKRVAFFVFIFLASVYVLCSSGRARTPDEYMTLFQSESLLDRGSTAVPQALQAQNLYGKFDLQHRPRSPYPAGQALLATPFVWFAREVLLRLPSVPQDRTAAFYLESFGATLSSATFAAAAMSIFFLFVRRLGLGNRDALFLSACVAFGTLLFPYSGYFFSEPLSTLLLLAAAYVLFDGEGSVSGIRVLLCGLLLGFAVWVRPTLVLASGVFALAILVREGRNGLKNALLVLLIPAVSGLGYLSWNKHLFGNAFDFGYPQIAELGKHLNTFQTPFHIGLAGLLFSPGKSVFLYFPLLILAICGISRLWRIDRGLAFVCAALPVVYLLFYMQYTQWEGGYCTGPRYMLPSTIVCCLALAPLLRSNSRAFRKSILALALIGFAVQIISYSTSFLEDEVGGHRYYDQNFDYRMTYNPMVSQTQRLFTYLSGKPAPLGLGFDRWFVFLHKLGIGTGTLVAIAIVPLGLAIWSFWMLTQVWIRSGETKMRAAES